MAAPTEPFRPLSDDDIQKFFNDIAGSDTATHVTFSQLEAKLHKVHEELAPQPKTHHLYHPTRAELEGGNGLHAFLVDLLPDISPDTTTPQTSAEGVKQHEIDSAFQINRADFAEEVRKWNVPSPDQKSHTEAQAEEADALEYERRLPFRRKLAAHWSVTGPIYLFLAFVTSLQLAFGIWQGVIYIQNQPIRQAFGWGVILAKFSAGALYPTLFFMLISMSRWTATFLRRSYIVSRFIDTDFHQSFHIRMSILGLLLATLHAIGHLTGTFLYGSRPGQAEALIAAGKPVRSYRDYVATLPGWTGIACLSMFWLIALLSAPAVRRWNFEVFQVGHLLMFPMVGLLAAHGTAKLLQSPMLGYWLVFPTIVVLLERLHRVFRSLRPIPARLEVLDEDTVCVTARHPRGKDWRYSAGQYILLQIPRISWFQFHPFTISACVDDCLQVHIKTSEGDWTSALRELALEVGSDEDVRIGIDGPFGAPAQRFYEYKKSIIVGSGIGITPFAAILNDLEQKALLSGINPWRKKGIRYNTLSKALSRTASIPSQVIGHVRSRSSTHSDENGGRTALFSASAVLKARERQSDDVKTVVNGESASEQTVADGNEEQKQIGDTEQRRPAERRVDFIWLVRDRSHLLWFSDLLNRVSKYAADLRDQTSASSTEQTNSDISGAVPIDVRVNTFITAKQKNISTHVFRILLDRYRTESSPVSALTGLHVESSFGRPDLEAMVEAFYSDIKEEGFAGNVGVFFCGTPVIGRLLADQCRELTRRARAEKVDVRFHFLNEVFG